MSSEDSNIIRASISVSLINGVSLLLGFFSQMLIAYYFGTSVALDGFLIAYAMPSVFMGIGGAVFSSCLVPALTAFKEDRESLSVSISNTLVLAATAAVVVSVAGGLSSGIALRASTDMSGVNMGQTESLAVIMWAAAGVSIFAGFLSTIYQLKKRFMIPSLVWLMPTTGMMLGVIFLSDYFGIMGMALGFLGFSVLSVLFLMMGGIKNDIRPRLITIRGVRQGLNAFSSIMPVGLSLLPFTILPAIDAYWASRLPEGSMSYLGYSTRLALALGNLVLNGIYMVILPYLSEDFNRNDDERFLSRLTGSIKAVLLFFIPAVFFIVLNRIEIVGFLFKRGAFTEASVEGVAAVLPFYMFGLLAMGPTTLVSRAYFARHEPWRFGVIGAIFIVFYAAASGLLAGAFSYKGIGIAYLMYWGMFFIAGAALLEKRILDQGMIKAMALYALISIASIGIAHAGAYGALGLRSFAGLATSGALSLMLFCLLSYLLRVRIFMSILKFSAINNGEF
ncbi:MAG: lipid II flippase MurJ [Deltaproteobacteria bacterium]